MCIRDSYRTARATFYVSIHTLVFVDTETPIVFGGQKPGSEVIFLNKLQKFFESALAGTPPPPTNPPCLLNKSAAPDEGVGVDLWGRRYFKNKSSVLSDS